MDTTHGPRSARSDSSRGEQGAVAVIVAAFIALVAIGAAAIAIDLGSLWSTQRALVSDTDAASLAGAQLMANATRAECVAEQSAAVAGSGAVFDEVSSILLANAPDIDQVEVRLGCPPAGSSATGATVRVRAQKEAIAAFAPALGFTDSSVQGVSLAEVGQIFEITGGPEGDGGLIPFAVCNEEIPVGQFGDGEGRSKLKIDEIVTIPFEPQSGQGCARDEDLDEDGDPPNGVGNWAWVGFDGNVGSGMGQTGPDCINANNPSLACYLHQGFPRTVDLAGNCGNYSTPGGPTECEASTGLVSTMASEFWKVYGCHGVGDKACSVFNFLLTDQVRDPGNNAENRVVGLVSAKLQQCNGAVPGPNGCQQTGGDLEYTFKIVDNVVSNAPGTNPGNGGGVSVGSTISALSICGGSANPDGDQCLWPLGGG